jgi:hypothetical protein
MGTFGTFGKGNCMFSRLRRLFAVGALGAALFAIAIGSVGSVSAAIDPVAFQKLGCTNGDLSCYYARLYGGYPLTVPYCDNTGCNAVAAGDAYVVPYAPAPYYAAPYANPYYVGYPYAYPAYAYPNVVVIAPTNPGAILPALNH